MPGDAPKRWDLRGAAPAPLDQGDTSSCVGHALAVGLAVSAASFGARPGLFPSGMIPSPLGIYTGARCLDRIATADGPLPSLTDDGAEPNQAYRAVAEWGLRPMLSLPSRRSDCDPQSVLLEPTLGELEAELRLRLIGAYRIDSSDEERALDVRTAIAHGFAVTLATFADQALEDWIPAHGPLGPPDESDPNGGGHYLCAVGYDKDVLIVRNSWGVSWGDSGDLLASSFWLDRATDLYAARIEVLP